MNNVVKASKLFLIQKRKYLHEHVTLLQKYERITYASALRFTGVRETRNATIITLVVHRGSDFCAHTLT